MTPSEFTLRISEVTASGQIPEFNLELNFPRIKNKVEFKNLSEFYEFVFRQDEGWKNLLATNKDFHRHNEFKPSVSFFDSLKNRIINDVNSLNTLANLPNTIRNEFRNSDNIFTYDCPETNFLIEIAMRFPNSLSTAHGYFTNQINLTHLSRESFIGYLLAYEFDTKGISEITKRKRSERTAMKQLDKAANNYYNKVNELLINQLKNIKTKYEEYTISIDNFRADKTDAYEKWFSGIDESFTTFHGNAGKKVTDLEDLYSGKLKLEEPAKYWEMRAKKMKSRGWTFAGWLIGLVFGTCIFLGLLLWKAPDTIFLSFTGDDKSAAIRWSVIFITFISFVAYCVRALTKGMFSAFHLAADCHERYTLTYFYLSLKKDSTIEHEEKQLIIQSLFSRADTGLLKDDSSPSMPGFIEKVVTK
jgi:hypothetical protein